MPRKKKKKGESEGRPLDLTAFLGEETPTAERKAERVGEEIKAPLLTDETASLIYEKISSTPGGLGKSELYRWAKKKGIKPADLYRAIIRLVSQGKIKRVFDPEKEEYVYLPAA